ncbi:MAG: glycoside hydrolase family 3 protein [Oscillospiraceae bacterium]|nr:glycoside hydrolase family 3 protein [Oscillospiraceae bacterium]
MTLRERVYQLFFVTPEQLGGSYPVTTEMNVTARPVGGVLCMGANLNTVSQTKDMLSKTQNQAMNNGIGVFIAVDEEGGTVARCAYKLGTTAFSGMAVYGARNDYDEAFGIGQTIGSDIKALGFNVDFAPVADVNIHPNNELGSRIFSKDPNVVANMVSGVVKGLNSAGVAATLKHFPGLGAENGNSHTESAIIIDRTLPELRSTEFVPFKGGIDAGADFVMVGHQQVTSFGDGLPADLSYTAVTEMLRGELGFNGIAITDAQNMNTISNVYYPGTAAVMSINAGIDMILCPTDLDSAANAVIQAVQSGKISEARINESVARILALKQRMGLLN